MNSQEFDALVSVSSIIAASYAISTAAKAGTPLSGSLVADAIDNAEAQSQSAAAIIKSGVEAFKQLQATGKLPTQNAAFDYLLLVADQYLPGLAATTLADFIEKFVPLVQDVYGALDVITPSTPAPAAPSPELPTPTPDTSSSDVSSNESVSSESTPATTMG